MSWDIPCLEWFEIPSHQKVNDLDFHGKIFSTFLGQISTPPKKKKKNRMQSSPLNQDDDIRSKQLGYIGNPNYYSRLIWVTGHPGSGVSNQHPKSNLKTHKLRPHQGFRGEFCPLEMFKSGTNPTHLRWPHLHLAGPADVRHGWRLVLHADMPCCDLLE